jgi:thiamine-phosphate pyrophosphorylase
MNPDHAALRILDASLNRATEGLRVVEDYARFVLDDVHLTEQLKRLRHNLAAAGAALPLPERHAVRDTQQDVGTTLTTPSEARRADAWDVCVASFERVKQSLRSLEEFGKVVSPELGAKFEAIRYQLYTLEAATGRTVDAVERLAAVRLYVLIDGRESESDFTALVQQLVAAGVGAIQLREKRLSDRELIARARLLKTA